MALPHDPIRVYAREQPRRPALVFEGEVWSWAELDVAVDRAAAFLDAGVAAGATVAVQGWNHPVFIALREAVYRTGRTFLALSPLATNAEIAHVLRLTQAEVFLRSPELAGCSVPALTWGAPFVVQARTVADRRAEAKTLLLTSGTTGLPKACVRPVQADTARMAAMTETFRLGRAQTHLVAAPLYHSGPAIFQRTHLALGCTTWLEPKFDTARVWAHVAAGHANTAFFVPTHYQKLLANDPGVSAQGIVTWWIAGAPARQALKERIIDRIGEGKLWEFLGSSETGTVSVLRPEEQRKKPGSVGRPPPNVSVRILGEDGTELPPGQVGLIYVRSPMLMTGYLAEEVASGQRRDDYLTVGDMGYLDEDGFLYLSDRRTDLIITGGVNVYPAEVEAALEALPGIKQACVVGLPDETWGSRVVAVLVVHGPVDLDAIQTALAERLSAPKRPKQYHVWEAIPHNAIGKPLRHEVRRKLLEPCVERR